MHIICLTGGIASGKSTAAKYLADRGAKVINADLLGHKAYLPGTLAYQQVIETFGEDLVDKKGQIDRKVLGEKVFGNPEALKQLTDIVWPEIRRLAESEIEQSARDNPQQIILLEAAVLFEAGWEDMGDEVWTVVVDPDLAVKRATVRDQVDAESVRRRLDAQLSNEERILRSDVVIENNTTEDDLLDHLKKQWERIQSLQPTP